nr:aminoacyl-tRNA synthetase, class 1a, anticodon-binding [Tanacetum cinerariifolium]
MDNAYLGTKELACPEQTAPDPSYGGSTGSYEAIWVSGGKGSCVWQNQHLWEIQSWRLYTLSNVHVLETVSSEVLSMFTDVSYPLSVKLIERMIMHKLEIDLNIVGNDLTTAEQLIQFIKNQLFVAQASSI